MHESINKLGSNSIYIQKWPWNFSNDFPWWKYLQRPQPTLRDYDALQRRCQSALALSYEVGIDSRTVKYRSNTVQGAQISAVSADHDKTWNFDFFQGRYFTEIESRTGSAVTLIGFDIAKDLFPENDAVGKTIKVMGRNVKIIGVFAKEGEDFLGVSNDKSILIPLNLAKNLIDVQSDKYGPQIVVKGKPGISDKEVESELEGLMRSIHRLRPNQEDDFSLNKATILTKGFDQLFSVLDKVGGFIGIFSILVGGFGIANIMFVSVKERTNIIGIQKSLGAKNYFIMLQFLIEAIVLCLLGGLIGLGMVFLLTLAVKAAIDIQVVLNIGNIVSGIGISLAIGVISGIIPAYSASRLDPVEAIRSN